MPRIEAAQNCSSEKLDISPTGNNRVAISKASRAAMTMTVIVSGSCNR